MGRTAVALFVFIVVTIAAMSITQPARLVYGPYLCSDSDGAVSFREAAYAPTRTLQSEARLLCGALSNAARAVAHGGTSVTYDTYDLIGIVWVSTTIPTVGSGSDCSTVRGTINGKRVKVNVCSEPEPDAGDGAEEP